MIDAQRSPSSTPMASSAHAPLHTPSTSEVRRPLSPRALRKLAGSPIILALQRRTSGFKTSLAPDAALPRRVFSSAPRDVNGRVTVEFEHSPAFASGTASRTQILYPTALPRRRPRTLLDGADVLTSALGVPPFQRTAPLPPGLTPPPICAETKSRSGIAARMLGSTMTSLAIVLTAEEHYEGGERGGGARRSTRLGCLHLRERCGVSGRNPERGLGMWSGYGWSEKK